MGSRHTKLGRVMFGCCLGGIWRRGGCDYVPLNIYEISWIIKNIIFGALSRHGILVPLAQGFYSLQLKPPLTKEFRASKDFLQCEAHCHKAFSVHPFSVVLLSLSWQWDSWAPLSSGLQVTRSQAMCPLTEWHLCHPVPGTEHSQMDLSSADISRRSGSPYKCPNGTWSWADL